MQFIGIDLHTNKFTCCYRDERSADKRTETFDLTEAGLAAFYGTLTAETANRRFECPGGSDDNDVFICPAV